jgi:TetR/AcrR family transcriptional regulator, mexJK operon transcriptional repressor
MCVIRRRIAKILEAGGVPTNRTTQVSGEVVAIALGDAYQHAVLGILEEGDGEAFARQVDAAVKYGLSRRA